MPVFTDKKKKTFIRKSWGCQFFGTDKFSCWCYILHALFCRAVKQETVTFVADSSPVKRKQFPGDKISSSMVSDDYRTTQFASVGFHDHLFTVQLVHNYPQAAEERASDKGARDHEIQYGSAILDLWVAISISEHLQLLLCGTG